MKPDGPTLSVELDAAAPVPVVAARGSASMSDTDILRDELERVAAGKPQALLLDMTELEFICSQGLGVLITIQGKLRRHGGSLKLVGVRPCIRRVLEVTRLTQMFDLYDSREQALAS